MNEKSNLKEVAQLFLKLGIIGFGGPAVHISMMQEEVVVKRKWLSEHHFLDLIGTTNLIPGPNSTEIAIHIGHERAGWKGLIVAGICFILPAVLITGFFAWLSWLFIHIFWLIGFRNRLAVMSEWAWAYLTLQRRVRLITGRNRPDNRETRAT